MNMTEQYKQRIKQALSSNDPTEQLRSYVFELKQIGMNQEEVYDIFYVQSLELLENHQESESELLEDVMDMITGWFVGKNIDFE